MTLYMYVTIHTVEGALRLVGSSTHSEGRVEVYHSGVWGTVCDDEWDLNDATVVCRQLNYFRAMAALGEAAFGAGTGPIHYDNVACTGSESRLANCSSQERNNCNHNEDAGVVCTDTQGECLRRSLRACTHDHGVLQCIYTLYN